MKPAWTNSNIRTVNNPEADAELEASLRAFGWRPEFPAYQDENGSVLVGNRRLAIARKLGIAPIIRVVQLGDNDEERMTIALTSNLGIAPMTKDDRKAIAEQLYGEGWTMQKIAERLKIGKSTIARDLEGIFPDGKKRTEKRGRPKSTPTKARDAQIIKDHDAGKPVKEAAEAAGLGDRRAARIIQDEQLKREGIEEGLLLAQPLSATVREKLDAHRRKLEKELDQRAHAMATAMFDDWRESGMAAFWDRLAKLERQLSTRPGVMKAAEYKTVMLVCHPDTGPNVSDSRRNEAVRILTGYKLQLLDEKEDQFVAKHGLPRNREELEKARAEIKAANSARAKAAHAARKAQKEATQ